MVDRMDDGPGKIEMALSAVDACVCTRLTGKIEMALSAVDAGLT
jgi:hypothetical protein